MEADSEHCYNGWHAKISERRRARNKELHPHHHLISISSLDSACARRA